MEANGASTSANDARKPAASETAVVRTFLIADVRGHTSFTQTHGDEGGKARPDIRSSCPQSGEGDRR